MEWIGKNANDVYIIPGTSKVVDCSLNDTSDTNDTNKVGVHLLKAGLDDKKNKTRLFPNGKITKTGQSFTIHNFQLSDNGYYYCRAVASGIVKDSQKIDYFVSSGGKIVILVSRMFYPFASFAKPISSYHISFIRETFFPTS